MELYQTIAGRVDTIRRIQKNESFACLQENYDLIESLEKLLPSGCGFDGGSHIDIDGSYHDRIVIFTGFHHMNDNGYYDGWTNHKVIIKASLAYNLSITVTGKNRNGIKDYISEIFLNALEQDVKYDQETNSYKLA